MKNIDLLNLYAPNGGLRGEEKFEYKITPPPNRKDGGGSLAPPAPHA